MSNLEQLDIIEDITEWARRNEWNGDSTPDGLSRCPVCRMDNWGGHSKKCWINKLINRKQTRHLA